MADNYSYQGELNRHYRDIRREYPKIPEMEVVPDHGKSWGHLEFYPAGEHNRAGKLVNSLDKPSIRVSDKTLVGPKLKSAIFGDMLHDRNIPGLNKLRGDIKKSLTKEQRQRSKSRYNRGKRLWNEKRTYDKFFEYSDLDAFIRGYLSPDWRNEWSNAYTDEQKSIMDQFIQSLRGN